MSKIKYAQLVTAPTRNWRLSASYESFVVQQTLVLRMSICGKNRQLLVAANRCTKGSLRSPSVQRGAAAPLLHEVLPTVAHRTTTVLQN